MVSGCSYENNIIYHTKVSEHENFQIYGDHIVAMYMYTYYSYVYYSLYSWKPCTDTDVVVSYSTNDCSFTINIDYSVQCSYTYVAKCKDALFVNVVYSMNFYSLLHGVMLILREDFNVKHYYGYFKHTENTQLYTADLNLESFSISHARFINNTHAITRLTC